MTKLGIGHMVRAMRLNGFMHDEIMAFRQFMIDEKGKSMGITKSFGFVDDCISDDWEDNSPLLHEVSAE